MSSMFFFSSRRRHTRCALVTGVQTCALPILVSGGDARGWFDRLRAELSSLVVIHKEGTLSSRPSDRLARARYLIEAGQVESALAEVRRLPGAPRADRWIPAAPHYVDSSQDRRVGKGCVTTCRSRG